MKASKEMQFDGKRMVQETVDAQAKKIYLYITVSAERFRFTIMSIVTV
ncbi:hypothetical protein [Salinicoccus halitifaciens]|uniref:Uncharacterized protein n=1 Tax=Salinicoccus halitifaciens TaxID=1073415 RepID=A0ABV2E6Y3_9STAP|nr:hypothetical protein [Salinicoccus halitifaciens]MCD2136766.1 hypothetical protein [Salinicoccus halitifaciens]